jgi:hypothetical protein
LPACRAAIGAITDSSVTVVFDARGLLFTAALDNLDQVDFIYKVGPFSFAVALWFSPYVLMTHHRYSRRSEKDELASAGIDSSI